MGLGVRTARPILPPQELTRISNNYPYVGPINGNIAGLSVWGGSR